MLILAMFIIVVLAVVASSSISILNSTELSNAHEVQSARAFNSAQSGVEKMMQTIFPRPLPGTPSSCPSNQTKTFAFDGLINCSNSVKCTSIDADSYRFYKVVSTGSCGGASRTLTVTARNL